MNADLQSRLAYHNRQRKIHDAQQELANIAAVFAHTADPYDVYVHGFPELNNGGVSSCPLNTTLSGSDIPVTAGGRIIWEASVRHTAVAIGNRVAADVLRDIVLVYNSEPKTAEISGDDLKMQVTCSWKSCLESYNELREIFPTCWLLIDGSLFLEDNGAIMRWTVLSV